MQFHDVYTVKTGDSLIRIAKSKGYNNPGPIVAYPPNQAFFRGRSLDVLRPYEKFFIPWNQDLLRKFIATMEDLIRSVNETATKLIEEEVKSREELESFLVMIDSINLILQIHVSIGSLVVESSAHGFEMSSEKVLEWLADSHVHMYAGDMVPLIVPAPLAPKKDYKFFVRHTLGPWTPSYWASVYTAIKTGDMDLYLYGSGALTYRNAQKISQNAKLEVIKLQAPLSHARAQLTMPFYQNKV
jgi:hypothetical protein